MTPHQIAATVLTLLAVSAGAVGAASVSNDVSIGPPPWANDEHEGDINVSVAGDVTPGETITLTATLHGEPVPHAPVSVNGELVGVTAADGTIEVTVPENADEFEVEIEPDYEGELERPLEADAQDDAGETEEDEDERRIDLAVGREVAPNETVTVTATVNGTPLANAEVTVNGEAVGTTGANGTIAVTMPEGADEFELEAEYEHEGSFEVAFESDEADDDDDERELDVAVDGEVAPGETVTVSVGHAGDAIEDATVTLNGDAVGTTGANGTLDVTLPADAEEIEVEVTSDDGGESEWEHEFEGADEEADEDDEAEGDGGDDSADD